MPANGGAPSAPTEKPSLVDRIKTAMLKPAVAEAAAEAEPAAKPPTAEELEATIKSADDKERAVGLVAAPLAGGIGLLIIDALIADDPAPYVGGHVNKLHVGVSLYHELAFVLIALAVLILATALLRKRVYLGILLALYGLTIFNLHYWGFGIPFVLAGAWLLVRAFRLQRSLREAREDDGRGRKAPPNKRYTPSAASARRATATAKAERPGKAV